MIIYKKYVFLIIISLKYLTTLFYLEIFKIKRFIIILYLYINFTYLLLSIRSLLI